MGRVKYDGRARIPDTARFKDIGENLVGKVGLTSRRINCICYGKLVIGMSAEVETLPRWVCLTLIQDLV